MTSDRPLIFTNWYTPSDKLFIQHAFGTDKVMFISGASSMDEVDLMYLTGGRDVDPRRYGGNPFQCHESDSVRDAWDMKYIPMALHQNIPIFGLCRGCQTLWVELGGRLKEEVHPTHKHLFINNSNIHHLRGKWGYNLVNSLHHQAPAYEIPFGVNVTLDSEDELHEAYIYGDRVCGVQWHPELLNHDRYVGILRAVINRSVNKMPLKEAWNGENTVEYAGPSVT